MARLSLPACVVAAVSLWCSLYAASSSSTSSPDSNSLWYSTLNTSSSPASYASLFPDRCRFILPIRAEIARYRPVVQRVLEYVLHGPYKGRTWAELARFTDTFGFRLAGTQNLENAIDYAMGKLRAENLENVHGERVEFTGWQRYNLYEIGIYRVIH